ncbi:MAG: hypothetical protein ABIT05_04540 [Chitinophagaceae bacterium]
MKPLSTSFYLTAGIILFLSLSENAGAQQYKLRQSNAMMGMKAASTIYVKGMRKRTEGGGYTGQVNNIVTIEQCDLQRTIKLNDKKKLYFIEPFAKDKEEVIDDDAKTPVKTKPVTTQPTGKGGVITMWYNITDTGERKKMYGFTARHIWTMQKMKPSPDACMMKDSMIIKTDGWYIDLPLFNCPETYTGRATAPDYQAKPDCQDRFVNHKSGKGKLGFPLTETRTMIMGNGQGQTSEFKMELETLELSTLKLDSMLFEIPPGYTLATNVSELQDKFDMNEYIKQSKEKYNDITNNTQQPSPTQEKKAGMTRIGVFEPTGEGQFPGAALQQQLIGNLSGGNIEAVAIASEEQAKEFHCDYQLKTDFTRVKQASKMGGLIKAIKNTDPSATSSYTIEASLLLLSTADGSTRLDQKVSGKYEGKPEEAAGKALEEGSRLVLKALK